MDVLAAPFLVYYALAIATFCVYSVHRFLLVVAYRGSSRRSDASRPPAADPSAGGCAELPTITVQLPMYNETAVAARVIEAACALDWPRDRLEIQVLDDSTDDCRAIAARTCAELAEQGHDVRHLHRALRDGYKAGALAAGLAVARGEFVAIFDADFVPAPDFLHRVMGAFAEPRVGLVQARWTYLNREASVLTRAQAMCLDGHFLIEQAARARCNRWFNFNGTAGVWRRACIDDAGGWEHDTLTEDTDLSYRAQMRGWRFEFRPDVTVPCELPASVAALSSQQHRWTKGLAQNAIKLAPSIARAPAPLATRLEALLHLTAPVPYAAMIILTLVTAAAVVTGPPMAGPSGAIAVIAGVACLALGSLAAGVFLFAGEMAALGSRDMVSIVRAMARVPIVMAIGIGLSVRNTAGIVEACIGRESAFVRTPKGGDGSGEGVSGRGARLALPGLAEVSLAVVMLACVVVASSGGFTIVGVPFLVLLASGYAAIGIPRLRQRTKNSPPGRV